MDKSEILSVEEDAAVTVFREAKGRGWKTALRLNWERSSYPGFSTDVSATLQSLRNSKGPDWLTKYAPLKDAEMRRELALVSPVIAEFTAVAIELGVPVEKSEAAGRQMFGSMAKAFDNIAKESDRDLKLCGLPTSLRPKPEIAVVEMLDSRSPEMRLGSIMNNCRPYVALYQDFEPEHTSATKQINEHVIGYAYPTSDHATLFGFGKQGCYTLLESGNLQGFASLQDAEEKAKTLGSIPGRWSLDHPANMTQNKQGVRTVVSDGFYSGKVLDVSADGVVTQKVSRDGLTVRHSLPSLSHPVAKGDLVDIKYAGGIGVVGGKDTQALGTGR